MGSMNGKSNGKASKTKVFRQRITMNEKVAKYNVKLSWLV